MVTFTVKGGGDASKPTTTSSGQTLANNNSSPTAAPPREGKDFPPSTAGDVDATKPLLTYSRPKGEYKAQDADPIMIDFWLSGAKLQGDGGEYRVRYIIDDDEPSGCLVGSTASTWSVLNFSTKMASPSKTAVIIRPAGKSR
jgi:hypothetical protein